MLFTRILLLVAGLVQSSPMRKNEVQLVFYKNDDCTEILTTKDLSPTHFKWFQCIDIDSPEGMQSMSIEVPPPVKLGHCSVDIYQNRACKGGNESVVAAWRHGKYRTADEFGDAGTCHRAKEVRNLGISVFNFCQLEVEGGTNL